MSNYDRLLKAYNQIFNGSEEDLLKNIITTLLYNAVTSGQLPEKILTYKIEITPPIKE